MTEEQLTTLRLQKGILSKLFKYLEFKGILYTVPFSDTLEGWDSWRDKVKKEHPIQYFIRDTVEDIEYTIVHRYYSIKYWVRTFLFPENKRIRAAIPVRGHDVTSIISAMNFAAILQYKEEADKSKVDWHAHESHKEFKDWLDRAAAWITEGKLNLEKELDKAYPSISIRDINNLDQEVFQDMYKEVHRLEDLIKQTDENILIQMIKYRDYFWT
jgi:hypothetical protein